LRFRVYITFWTLAFALGEHVGGPYYTLLPWQLPTNDIVFKTVEIFAQKKSSNENKIKLKEKIESTRIFYLSK
jgi:hypothetical protein